MNIGPNRTRVPAVSPPPASAFVPTPVRPRSYKWAVVLGMVVATLCWWSWDRFVRVSAFGVVSAETLMIGAPVDGLIESMPIMTDESYPGEFVAFSISDRQLRDQLEQLQLQLALVDSELRAPYNNSQRLTAR